MDRHRHDLLTEAAVILWEWMNDNSSDDSPYPQLYLLRQGVGTAELRHHAIALAPYMLAVCRFLDGDLLDSCPYDDVLFSIAATIDWTKAAREQLPPREAAARVSPQLSAAFLVAERSEDRSGYSTQPVAPPTRSFTRARTRATFDTLFRPLPHDDKRMDGFMWDGDDLPDHADERHWWTVVEATERGPFHLEAGIHRAGRIGLIRCGNRWGGDWQDHPHYIY